MVARTMWVSLLVVGFMAVSGLGFAAFTVSPLSATNSATAGSASWVLDTFSVTASESPVTTDCSWTNTATAMSITGTNFAPGDWCSDFGSVHNTGTLPLTVSYTITGPSNGACFNGQIGQPTGTNNPLPASGFPLAGGASQPFYIALELTEGVPGSCSSESSGAFVITFTAAVSASPTEVNEPGGGTAANL